MYVYAWVCSHWGEYMMFLLNEVDTHISTQANSATGQSLADVIQTD